MVATKFQTKMWANDTIRIAEKKIDLYARTHQYELSSVNTSPEDFKQEIFAFWCRSNGYNNFDPTKKKFENYVLLICKRHIGDLIKKRDAKMRVPLNAQTSIDEPVFDGSATFGDTIDIGKPDVDYSFFVESCLNVLPDYKIELTKKTLNVTYKTFFKDYLDFDIPEMAANYGLTVAETKEAFNEIRDYIKFKLLDDTDSKDIYYIRKCISILPDTNIELAKKTLNVTYKELYKNYFSFTAHELAINYDLTVKEIKEALTEINDYLRFRLSK